MEELEKTSENEQKDEKREQPRLLGGLNSLATLSIMLVDE